jgi:hypothetical protein
MKNPPIVAGFLFSGLWRARNAVENFTQSES